MMSSVLVSGLHHIIMPLTSKSFGFAVPLSVIFRARYLENYLSYGLKLGELFDDDE